MLLFQFSIRVSIRCFDCMILNMYIYFLTHEFLRNDRQRWIAAIMPPQSTNPDEKLYDEWDCPQAICTRAYSALQPDELTLDEADSVNVFRKLNGEQCISISGF